MDEIQLAGICTDLAEMLISYGAEIYRVEDTITRICSIYGHTEAEIYATPANFIITLKNAEGIPFTDSRTIKGRDTNLDRVGRINELSRTICAQKPTSEIIRHKIEQIKKRKNYSPAVIYLSYFIAGAAFTVSFGGDLKEAVFGGLLGLVINFLSIRLGKANASAFTRAVACSAAISLISVELCSIGLVPRFDCMIIGASMALVPGVALTNCMRDFISGDFISGIYTLTEALLIAVGMAVGAGSAVAAVIKM